MNMIELALRLKKVRTEQNLTLEQVASRAGLSRGWLSKVENFRVTPSLQSISDLAGALGVSLSELFEGLDARPPLTVVRINERRRFYRDEEVSKLTYDALAYPRPAREMDPFLLTVPPDDDRPCLSHAGEEFLLVIEGSVILEHGDESHELAPGDAAYFDGPHPHRLICTSNKPAQVLVVYHGRQDGPAERGAAESNGRGNHD